MEILKPQKGESFIDGTFGAGGHSEKILEAIGDSGKLISFDWDEKARERNKNIFGRNNFLFIHGNYKNIKEVLKEKSLSKVDGLLLDLGFSSDQLEDSGKGFSFKKDEPLVMSYGESGLTAADVVNSYSEEQLKEIIKTFGEEKYPGRIARAIVEARRQAPIKSSFQLAQIVRSVLPRGYERGRIDPATRTFQAIRIFVNGELDNLQKVLRDLKEIVKSEGRVAIISFHSLEDRIVKNVFRDFKKEGVAEILTKKPITASLEEIKNNPRSRSAKLRGIKII